jgi:hypothetical protein
VIKPCKRLCISLEQEEAAKGRDTPAFKEVWECDQLSDILPVAENFVVHIRRRKRAVDQIVKVLEVDFMEDVDLVLGEPIDAGVLQASGLLIGGKLSNEFFALAFAFVKHLLTNIIYELFLVEVFHLSPDGFVSVLSLWISCKKFPDHVAQSCRVFNLLIALK